MNEVAKAAWRHKDQDNKPRILPLLISDDPENLTNQELEVLASKIEKTVLDLEAYGCFEVLTNLLRYRLREVYSVQHYRAQDIEWNGEDTIIKDMRIEFDNTIFAEASQ
jgi:hypothetical protein